VVLPPDDGGLSIFWGIGATGVAAVALSVAIVFGLKADNYVGLFADANDRNPKDSSKGTQVDAYGAQHDALIANIMYGVGAAAAAAAIPLFIFARSAESAPVPRLTVVPMFTPSSAGVAACVTY
jgi:hypothetical protein